MDYLVENLSLLYTSSGWTYDILAEKMKRNVSERQQFSKDQIRSYEQRLSTPKPHFKNVFAKFLGLEVNDVVGRKLTVAEITERISRPDDAGEEIIANQIEMIAQQRVILSLLASIKKPGKSSSAVRDTLQMMVEEEKEIVLREKKLKS